MHKRHLLYTVFFGALLASTNAIAQEATKFKNPAEMWEHTWWTNVMLDLVVIAVVFSVVTIWLLVRYRAKDINKPNAGAAKTLSFEAALAWALIPAAIFMAEDFLLAAKGFSLFQVQRSVPANAKEIKVTGSQWAFQFDYGDGIVDSNLNVPVGQPIVLRMTSTDVIHSFGLADYKIKEDLLPGRVTYLWFYPNKELASQVTCVEFCGDGHSVMKSEVNALSPEKYNAWLASKKPKS